jgi:hypothetical protein
VGGASGWSSTPLGPGYLFVNPAVLQLCRLDAAAVFTPAPVLPDKTISGSQGNRGLVLLGLLSLVLPRFSGGPLPALDQQLWWFPIRLKRGLAIARYFNAQCFYAAKNRFPKAV